MTSSASSSWAHNVLNFLVTVILESDLIFVALLGNVLFKLPFPNFPLYCTGFSVSTTNACLRSLLLHHLCAVWMLHLTNLTFLLLWKVFSIQVSCVLSVKNTWIVINNFFKKFMLHWMQSPWYTIQRIKSPDYIVTWLKTKSTCQREWSLLNNEILKWKLSHKCILY